MTSRKPPSQRDPEYALARMARAVQSMSPGSMGGRVANAAPMGSGSGTGTAVVIGTGSGASDDLIFSQGGELDETESASYMLRSAVQLVDMAVHMRVAGTSSSTILLLQNGVTVHTLTVAAGVAQVVELVGVSASAGDFISVQCTTAGAGATAVVVQVAIA